MHALTNYEKAQHVLFLTSPVFAKYVEVQRAKNILMNCQVTVCVGVGGDGTLDAMKVLATTTPSCTELKLRSLYRYQMVSQWGKRSRF